ncbi:MAG TPA: hypothetical protein VLE91_01320 [Candidatus Saccharimonadales bacterium]|nr:hypothetical protein [Candidatus Saccharimonadales bacterium]
MSDRRPHLGDLLFKYVPPVAFIGASVFSTACSGDNAQENALRAQFNASAVPGAVRDIKSFPTPSIPGRPTKAEATISPTPLPTPESNGRPTLSIDNLNIELTVRKAQEFREIITERAKTLPELNLGKITQFKDVNNADLTKVPWTQFPSDFIQKYGIESFASFTVTTNQSEIFFMTLRLNGVQAAAPKPTIPNLNPQDIPLSAFMLTTENDYSLNEVVGGIDTVTEKGKYIILAFGGGVKEPLDKLSGKKFVVLINSGALTKDGKPNPTFSLPYQFQFDVHSTPKGPLIPVGPIRPA